MPSKYVPINPIGTPASSTAAPAAPVDTSNTYPKLAVLTRLLAGLGSGAVGMEPGLGSAAAGAIGAGGEWAAQKLENPTGTPINKSRVTAEGVLSAVPLGKIYEGANIAKNAASVMRGNIARGSILAEIGNILRRKTATGDYWPHDSKEALSDVASTVLGGAVGVPTAMLASHGIAQELTPLEQAVARATSGKLPVPADLPAPKSFGGTPQEWADAVASQRRSIPQKPSDVGQGGVTVPADLPRVVKPGGLRVQGPPLTGDITLPAVGQEVSRVQNGVQISDQAPISPKVAEVMADVRDQPPPKIEIPAFPHDLTQGIENARTISKAQRAENEGARKVETKLLGKEQTADLQDLKAQQQAASGVSTLLPRLLKKPPVPVEVSQLEKGIQQASAEGGANRAQNFRDETQGQRLENAADLENLRTTMGGTDVNTIAQKAAAAEAQAEKLKTAEADRIAAQKKIDTVLNNPNVTATPAVVTESAKVKVPGGTQGVRQTFSEPTPPPPEEPETPPFTADKLPPREVVAQTVYTNKKVARRDARAYGGTDAGVDLVKSPTEQGYRVSFPDIPVTPVPKTEMPPSLERDAISLKKYTNKTEAAAIAKATGGEVHQDGPRRYSVRFAQDVPPVEPTLPDEPAASAAPPVAEPPFRPSTPLPKPSEPTLPPLQTGDLTPEEFRRYMDIRPGMGTKRTPAELAEYRAFQDRINSGGPPPVAEVSDYTGGQPEHTIDVPPPGGNPTTPPTPGEPPVGESPLSVEEFAKALDKEGKKPIADLPYNLTPTTGKVQKAADVAGGSQKLGELLDAIHGEESTLPGNGTGPELPTTPTPPAEGGAAPIRVFKTPLEAAGAGYGDIKAAKAAGENVPEEGRSIAGRVAQRLAGESKKIEAAAQQKADELAGPDSASLAKLPPEEQSRMLSDLVEKFKSSKGEITPILLARAGLGAAGAAAGAASMPDDPLTGAILGGSVGAFAPTVVRALIQHASTSSLPTSSLSAIAQKSFDTAETFARMLPDYQRFAILSKPYNLAVNMWVGPWGSAIMACIEHAIQFDQRGIDGLKLLLNPVNYPTKWAKALPEAAQLISNAEERTEGTLGQTGPKLFRQITQLPGVGMTAGDVAARDMLVQVGFTPPEAKRITLTSEPYSPLGRGVSALKKGAKTVGGKTSWAVNMALPFYRTNMNQLEQGMERFPGLGFAFQRYAKDIPDPLKAQIAQQFLGGTVGTASYMLGLVVPEDQARYVRKFIGDFGGQYGILASAGFILGEANQNDKSALKALKNEIISRDMPLPSMDIINNMLDDAGYIDSGDTDKMKSPFQLMPGVLDPNDPMSLTSAAQQVYGLMNGDTNPSSGVSVTPPSPTTTRSRYVPVKPRQTK